MINQPKRKIGFEIPEMILCEDFIIDDPEKYDYEKTGCLGCKFSHEMYHKTGGFMSGYERTSGPRCEFGEITEQIQGIKKVWGEDVRPHPTAVVSLSKTTEIVHWLNISSIWPHAHMENMGEIMYRIAEVPIVFSDNYHGKDPISEKEIHVLMDKRNAKDEEFKSFKKLGGHGLGQDSFTKLRKKGKTIEEIVDLFK